MASKPAQLRVTQTGPQKEIFLGGAKADNNDDVPPEIK